MESVVRDESAACNTSQTPAMFEVDKEFILTYESLPELWNTTDLRYTNKAIRTKALEKLLVIYQRLKPYATIEDVRKKINSLRSNYRRELNKVVASERSGAPDVYHPKAWYFPYLNFFRKLEHPEYQNEASTSTTVDTSSEVTQTQEDLKKDRCESSKAKTPPSTVLSKTKSKMTQNLRRDIQYKPYQLQHECKVSNPIALEWANTLERLDPMQRLYAKKAINDILFEAELGNLHKHSVTINEPYSHYLPTSSTVLSSSVISPHHPPSPSQQADPISVVHETKDESSSDVEYKVSITEYEN